MQKRLSLSSVAENKHSRIPNKPDSSAIAARGHTSDVDAGRAGKTGLNEKSCDSHKKITSGETASLGYNWETLIILSQLNTAKTKIRYRDSHVNLLDVLGFVSVN